MTIGLKFISDYQYFSAAGPGNINSYFNSGYEGFKYEAIDPAVHTQYLSRNSNKLK